MKLLTVLCATSISALSFFTTANAASYDMSYVETAAGSAFLTDGVGNVGASMNVGDSLTVSVKSPSGKESVTNGGSFFDYQEVLGTGSSRIENVSYAFYLDGVSVLSGIINNAQVCCVDLRLPLYNVSSLTWDELVYTATLVSSSGTTIIENGFNESQSNTVFAAEAAAIPEPATLALMGLVFAGMTYQRRRLE